MKAEYIKTISLWEPWGTAIRKRLKKIETRSWWTNYRGPLAIHCAKTRESDDFIFDPMVREHFEFAGIFQTDQLAFGCIVATCDLVEVVPTEVLTHCGLVTPMEMAFGDYRAGRFGWRLENVVPLDRPVLFRGAQGFFNVPLSLLAA